MTKITLSEALELVPVRGLNSTDNILTHQHWKNKQGNKVIAETRLRSVAYYSRGWRKLTESP